MTAVDGQARVLLDIERERDAQDEKWGPQTHPGVDQVLMWRVGGCSPQRMAEEYGIPTATAARNACDGAARNGAVTWAHIAVEEFAEAIESAVLCDGNLRTELVQTTAVLVAWIEDLDRKAAA